MPISIGIPFYNAEAYLADAVRSIFAQTYQDWELLLVDDGSTDRSLEIARSIRDPRVRVISDGRNRKLSYRLNQIVAEAKYDLVGRMDADDLISPERFEKQKELLDAHPEFDLVSTGICSITNDNQPCGVRFISPDTQITGRKLLLGHCVPAHATILGRTEWFLRNPYDNMQYRDQDYELWLRAYSKKDFKLCFMSEPLYYYREEDNVTPNRLLSAYKSQRRLYKRFGYLGFNSIEIPAGIAKLYGKSVIVNFLSMFNKTDILLKKRNKAFGGDSEMEAFKHEIKYIISTKVSGLD